MVRLIRIASNDKNGLFDNNFSTDIPVDETNSIALQSCSFSGVFNILRVDGINELISFKYTDTDEIQAVLTHKDQYDNSNKDDLFSDMTTALNKGLVYKGGKTIGLEFLAEVNSIADKVQIGYQKSNLSSNDSRVTRDGTSEYQGMEVASNKYRKQTSDDSTDDSTKYYSMIPWGQGCHIHRIRIVDFVDNGDATANNGLILGLSNSAPVNWKTSPNMTDDQKTYYIRFSRGNETYKVKVKDGTETDTGVAPTLVAGSAQNNDIIEIVRAGSEIKALLYRHDQASVETLFVAPQLDGEELFPFITLQGGNNSVKFNRAVHTIDPYHTSHIANEEEEESLGARPNPPPSGAGAATPTNNTLILPITVSQFCGFNNFENLQSATNALFQAENIFEATTSNTSFIIELTNLDIDSYNGKSNEDGAKQNIIAVIPTSNNETHKIIEYESQNLYYVDIKQKTNIRNIRARILRIDGTTPVLTGLSVLTFLIK